MFDAAPLASFPGLKFSITGQFVTDTTFTEGNLRAKVGEWQREHLTLMVQAFVVTDVCISEHLIGERRAFNGNPGSDETVTATSVVGFIVRGFFVYANKNPLDPNQDYGPVLALANFLHRELSPIVVLYEVEKGQWQNLAVPSHASLSALLFGRSQ